MVSPVHEAETVPEACLGYGFGSGTGDLIAGMPHGPMLQASAAESRKTPFLSVRAKGHTVGAKLSRKFISNCVVSLLQKFQMATSADTM